MNNKIPEVGQFSNERMVKVRRGWIRLWIVMILLRLLVKWTSRPGIDVGRTRDLQARLGRRMLRIPAGVARVGDVVGGVPGEWLVPQASPEGRMILYVHGGAFIASSPDLHATLVSGWCKALNVRAFLIDYRLAPEHRHPAAIEDVFSVYSMLIDRGVDPGQVIVAGDSAGGNLILALLNLIKARELPQPACAVVMSPLVDFTLSSPSMVTKASADPLFTQGFAMEIRGLYASPEQFLDPLVSPIYAELSGLPPILLQVGSQEMLLDDSRRYAAKAGLARLDVELEIWDGLPHVFQAMPILPHASEASDHIVAFIRRKLGWH